MPTVPALRERIERELSTPRNGWLRDAKGGNVSNAGLELDRYSPQFGSTRGQETPKVRLVQRVAGAHPPDGYEQAFRRWRQALEGLPGIHFASFKIAGRAIVGLGAPSVLETSITLSRAWGMPYIPGTALKGLANHVVSQELGAKDANFKPATVSDEKQPPNAHGVLFGTPSTAGYVTWHDAWWAPVPLQKTRLPEAAALPFRRDVITTHHPGYYQQRGAADANPPWDFDDPTPIPFLSVGGTFLLAVQVPNDSWWQLVLKILERAAATRGIGAKTSAGYGCGTVKPLEPETKPGTTGGIPAALASDAARNLWRELTVTGSAHMGERLDVLDKLWQELTDDHERAQIARQFTKLLNEIPDSKQRWLEGNKLWKKSTGKDGRGPKQFVIDVVAFAAAHPESGGDGA